MNKFSESAASDIFRPLTTPVTAVYNARGYLRLPKGLDFTCLARIVLVPANQSRFCFLSVVSRKSASQEKPARAAVQFLASRLPHKVWHRSKPLSYGRAGEATGSRQTLQELHFSMSDQTLAWIGKTWSVMPSFVRVVTVGFKDQPCLQSQSIMERIFQLSLLLCICWCLGAIYAPPGPWDAYNLSPNRQIRPSRVHSSDGIVYHPDLLCQEGGVANLSVGSSITLDFDKEVGGQIGFYVEEGSIVRLSFTESPLYIGPNSDRSTENGQDGFLELYVREQSQQFVPTDKLRGGFRYLTIFAVTYLELRDVILNITFSPHVEDLKRYSGYFYSDDDLLNRIWYSGAYTVQTCVIASNEGRRWPEVSAGWENDGAVGIRSPVLTDAAKRDRTVWAGDLAVSIDTTVTSTGDMLAVRNSIDTLFAAQRDGLFPWAGPPISIYNSDTYHMWTLSAVHDDFIFSGDVTWLEGLWDRYTRGLSLMQEKIGAEKQKLNLQSVAGFTSHANAIYYKVLLNSVYLASVLGKKEESHTFSSQARKLKTSFHSAFWDEDEHMFRNEAPSDDKIFPQDSNSLAVLFQLTDEKRGKQISLKLEERWNAFGAVSTENPRITSPFITSFEVAAHFLAGETDRALRLVRLQWGYMISTNLSVQSTLLEGYAEDGGLNYGYGAGEAYTSHSHGWSTGPTSSLTFYLLGLRLNEPKLDRKAGRWTFHPHLANVTGVEGGFDTRWGRLDASWMLQNRTLMAKVEAPEDMNGSFRISGECSWNQLIIDGKSSNFTRRGDVWVSPRLTGGVHSITVVYI
ncbi:hypothetical protein PROFUN_06207 [Planoprotostelium fungivorum]|uniref:Alpha-L-rhamnosidase six-hairpin glycosidase domain-containing protein n=1 Tax=Planoprotostelium fungivorum TaxID=1890364 RepID=A0A2P6MZ07_9EUKA|nr:hypothetical protein PROFUN_06207 [Planoprotostelium fungivorum]